MKSSSAMRIFIAFEGSRQPFDINQDQTIGTIKAIIRDHFHTQLLNDRRVRRFLELRFAGATLQDSWTLPDVGIAPGSTISCLLQEESRPILYVFCSVTKETLPLMGNIIHLGASVSSLKSLVSLQSGLPVSTFRLTTQTGLELYHCNTLNSYIKMGATLHLDVWDGWVELLKGCHLGDKHTVQHYLSEDAPILRFQQRVALYMAAFFGHLDLAVWLLKRGVRPNEPVGAHPYREWCWEADHPEINKCPVHGAAEAGQLLILKVFISGNILSLDCLDPEGRTPLQIAIRQRHKECVCYLASKLWSVACFQGFTFPMWIYVQIKHWAQKAQKKASSSQGLAFGASFRTMVGSIVFVDGFSKPMMTSKARNKVFKEGAIRDAALPDLARSKDLAAPSDHPAGLDSQDAPVRLPQLLPEMANSNRPNKGSRGNSYLDGSGDQDRKTWATKVPISCDTPPQHQSNCTLPSTSLSLTSSTYSFSQQRLRTPRENAIHCLSVASSFTERSWLQQLAIARILTKRTAGNTL
ncbi:protein ANKUB1-like isoform X1 [Brienomyrus brachyistius]|uniref:protein ANKUB1-like isoform X1 n=1 Tax=Brienomyrus brachyistius TaxID=42636 RepID=UPI0020B1C989|nr:protein ANKUB1-like isoform X1 [Brienomyrus brachyistius]